MMAADEDVKPEQLPAGWQWARLGEVARFAGGGTPARRNPDYWGGDIPWASIKDLAGGHLTATQEFITVAGLDNSSSRLVPPGIPIIATRINVGQVATFDRPVAINQDLKAVFPKEERLRSAYLAAFLTSKKDYLAGIAVGSTVKGIKLEALKRLSILLPPLPEQQRIANLLNKQLASVEKATRAAQERLEAAQSLAGAYLREMIPASDETLPEGWRIVTLAEVCEIVTGATPKRSNASYYGGDVPWVNPGNLGVAKFVCDSAEYLTEDGVKNARPIPGGSVLVTCISGSIRHIGKVGIAGRRLCTNQQINSLVPHDSVASHYLYYLMQAIKPVLENLSSSTNQNIVNKSKLSGVTIPLPPIEEQRRTAAQLDDRYAKVQSVEWTIRQELETVEAMPDALLRRAFIGAL
jgi:type I restriction enzyme, S subunit